MNADLLRALQFLAVPGARLVCVSFKEFGLPLPLRDVEHDGEYVHAISEATFADLQPYLDAQPSERRWRAFYVINAAGRTALAAAEAEHEEAREG